MDVIFNADAYERLYNCSSYTVNQIPLEQRKRPWLGAAAIVAFVVFQSLYVFVIPALYRHLNQSCYKMMFLIGLIDMPALCVNALLSGIFALRGAVFCSFPRINIFAGFMGMFFWHAETHLAILLALNRLFTLAVPRLNHFLFNGKRTWLCCSIVLLYSSLFACSQFPLTWSSLTFSWFFDPHIGYLKMPANTYENKWDAAEAAIVAFSPPIIYLAYFAFLLRCGDYRTPATDQLVARIIFVQIFLLCTVNSLEAMIYFLMGLFPSYVYPELVVFGTFTWIGIHGLPPLIYLTINKTLRRECRMLIGLTKPTVTSAVQPITREN